MQSIQEEKISNNHPQGDQTKDSELLQFNNRKLYIQKIGQEPTEVEIPQYSSDVNIVKASTVKTLAAIGFTNGTILLRDYKAAEMNNNTVSQEKKHNATVTLIEFNPASKQLVTADEGGTLVVWNVQMGLLRFNCEQKKTGSIDHCIFYTNFNEKAYELLFSFGGSNGHIYLAYLNNVCPEICKVGGGIKALLYQKEDNSVIIISSRLLMVKFKAAFDKNIVPDRKVKLSISGDPESLVSIWAGKGLLATTASEKIIRMWNMKQDENQNLSLANSTFEDRISSDLFTNICYCARSRTLAACTDKGKIVFFKSKLEELSPRSEEHWDLTNIQLPETQMAYNQITWSKSETQSILSAFSTEKIVTLKENNLQLSYNFGNLVVQKELCKFFILQSDLSKNNKEQEDQVTTKLSAPIGFDSQKKTFAVWEEGTIEVWEIILSNKMKKVVGKFELDKPEVIRVCNNHIVTLSNYTISVQSPKGELIKDIRYLENEGKPKILECNGEFFVVATTTNLIKIFEIDKKPEVKQKSLSRYFVDSNNKAQGNLRSLALNNDCSKVAILSTDSFGIDQKKLQIQNVDTDSFLSQSFERNETLQQMQWDTVDPRLFALQIETKNEKDQYEFTKRCETYFVTNENGISAQETVNFNPNQKNLMGIKTPHFIFENNFTLKEAEEEQTSVTSLRQVSQLMRDQENINTEIDSNLKSSLLDFSQHLTCGNLDEAQKAIRLINNRVIWEKMTQMCIKKRSIGVLEVCLANMRFLRGAQALREAKRKQAEPETQLAMVAIHLNMIDEAKELLTECKRYDLLNEMYQSSAMFEEAIEVAQKNDRINLKNTQSNQVSFLELTENYEVAEKQQEHVNQNPTKQLEEIIRSQTAQEVEEYLEGKNLPELYKFQAEYLESRKQDYEKVKKFYELSNDQTSVVRMTLTNQEVDKAIKLCMDYNNPSAYYYLAKVLEEGEHVQQAIEFYKKSGRTSKAIKLAKEHGMDEEVIRMSLVSSDRDSMLISAQHFEQKGQYEQAVLLQNKCGQQSKAIELCFNQKLFDKLKSILEDLKDLQDQDLLQKVCDFFMGQNEQDKAVGILLKLGQADQAMHLIQTHDVPLDDETADLLTPELGSVDNETRNGILISIGKIAKRQQNFALAAKKQTQAGAKLKAIKALIKVGNLDKVVTFAQTARDPQCYILAGNQLQTTDWHNDAKIMTNIINFYTKAKSYEQLAGFYELCSWVEIDEYRDQEKALSALNQALKLYNKNDSRDKSQMVERRIKVVERFVEARGLEQTNQQEMVEVCKELLNMPDAESYLRVGDVYSQLVEQQYNQKDQRSAYSQIEHMKRKGIIMDPYLDKQLIADIYKQLNIKVDEDSDIEEDMDM